MQCPDRSKRDAVWYLETPEQVDFGKQDDKACSRRLGLDLLLVLCTHGNSMAITGDAGVFVTRVVL